MPTDYWRLVHSAYLSKPGRKSYMQHLELLAYSYDLAYSNTQSEQGASNPLASKLFSTNSATSVYISRIDWPYLRYAYVKALNIDYFMMLDTPADKDKFNNIIMRGTFRMLMDQVVMWMENERIQNRGKYFHPRDRIPGRTLATARQQTVAFSVTEDSNDDNAETFSYLWSVYFAILLHWIYMFSFTNT